MRTMEAAHSISLPSPTAIFGGVLVAALSARDDALEAALISLERSVAVGETIKTEFLTKLANWLDVVSREITDRDPEKIESDVGWLLSEEQRWVEDWQQLRKVSSALAGAIREYSPKTWKRVRPALNRADDLSREIALAWRDVRWEIMALRASRLPPAPAGPPTGEPTDLDAIVRRAH